MHHLPCLCLQKSAFCFAQAFKRLRWSSISFKWPQKSLHSCWRYPVLFMVCSSPLVCNTTNHTRNLCQYSDTYIKKPCIFVKQWHGPSSTWASRIPVRFLESALRQCLHWRHTTIHTTKPRNVVGDLEIWRQKSGGKETETMRTIES